MRNLVAITLVLGLLATTAGTASAQDGRDLRQGIISGFMLLTQKSVQKELKLSDDQIKKLEAALAKQKEIYQGLGDLDAKERAKKLAQLSVAGEKAISETLKPEQIKRFVEISRHHEGLHQSVEAKDGEVAAALRLTDDQKAKIKTIGEELGTEVREAVKAAAGDRTKMAAKMQDLRKSGDEKLMKLLTDEQKTKWRELIGEPFKGELTR